MEINDFFLEKFPTETEKFKNSKNKNVNKIFSFLIEL